VDTEKRRRRPPKERRSAAFYGLASDAVLQFSASMGRRAGNPAA